MKLSVRLASAVVIALVLVVAISTYHSSNTARAQASGLPDWILQPEVLPSGLEGFDNCTFALNGVLEPDGTCWERSGPQGIKREQFSGLRVLSLQACGGGPGHVAGIRICRLDFPGQLTLCGRAGPRGCAGCPGTVTVTCGL